MAEQARVNREIATLEVFASKSEGGDVAKGLSKLVARGLDADENEVVAECAKHLISELENGLPNPWAGPYSSLAIIRALEKRGVG